ncbi:unnamed protein product [Ectocarpus sp. 12 AP-2014]
MRIGLSRNERVTSKEWNNEWRTDADSDSVFSTCDSRRCAESQAEVTLRKSANRTDRPSYSRSGIIGSNFTSNCDVKSSHTIRCDPRWLVNGTRIGSRRLAPRK